MGYRGISKQKYEDLGYLYFIEIWVRKIMIAHKDMRVPGSLFSVHRIQVGEDDPLVLW